MPFSSSRATRRTWIDGEALRAAVRDLETDLPSAERVTVTVDGESIELPAPDAVEIDADESRLPFVDDPISLELRWSSGEE